MMSDSPPPTPSERIGAGASARREYERRVAARDRRVRTKHPAVGGLVLALVPPPQSITAWRTGAQGEERLGQRLDRLVSPTMHVLHDRRIPGTRANVDHLVVTSLGVTVIDAKHYRGRPRLKVRGGLWGAADRGVLRRAPKLHDSCRQGALAS